MEWFKSVLFVREKSFKKSFQIQFAVYYVETNANGQEEPHFMFVSKEADLCQYLNRSLHQANDGILAPLVKQWSLSGNLRHPCPYQVFEQKSEKT